jgi:hypothetical protein
MPVKRPSSRSKPSAIERTSARRLVWMRLSRTVVLGALATIAAIVWLGEQYGIQRDVILAFLGTSALFVGLLILAGALGMVLLWGVRKLLGR